MLHSLCLFHRHISFWTQDVLTFKTEIKSGMGQTDTLAGCSMPWHSMLLALVQEVPASRSEKIGYAAFVAVSACRFSEKVVVFYCRPIVIASCWVKLLSNTEVMLLPQSKLCMSFSLTNYYYVEGDSALVKIMTIFSALAKQLQIS